MNVHRRRLTSRMVETASRPLTAVSISLLVFGTTHIAAWAESLPANTSTSYSAVVHFDRSDYFVENRYGPTTPTQSAAKLETAIVFNQGAFMEPDSNGRLSLPANFPERVAFVKNASPNAKLTLGVFSLRHIVGKNQAIQTFINELQTLIETYQFSGIDIDWEDMPNTGTYVSPAAYGQTIKAISDVLRPAGIIISTSHAQGAQYEPYAAEIANVVDFLNLQFYFSQTNAMDLATFKSRLSAFIGRGLRASQIRVGLPSYGMTAQSNTTSDKWRSWNILRNAGVDLTNANQWTDPSNGHIYYFSGLNLINAKVNYARTNGFAGVFTWELTQDTNYTHALSINRRIDDLATTTPVLELNNSNTGTGTLGTGVVNLGSGRVLNHGILRFARDGSNIYPNMIQGPGRLETAGTGTTILTGQSTYTGGTFVAAGSQLNIGNGAAQGSITGSVEVNGTFIINRSDNLTLSNTITGTGNVVKAGTGQLAIGEGKLANTLTTFSINGGTATNIGDLEYSGNVLIGDAVAGSFTQNSGTVTFSKQSSGWGIGLNIAHRIGGVGTYTINGGTLKVPNALTVISAGGTASGTLTLTGTARAELKGVSMGTSANGTARINLTGGHLILGDGGISNATPPATSALREIHLGAGTLGALEDWSSQLNITLTDPVQGVTIETSDAEFPQSPRHISLDGDLSGPGKLTLSGTGKLTLSGTNTYTGSTTITAGNLSLEGSLTSPCTVEGSGKLSGSGSINAPLSIRSGGTLAPTAAATLTTADLDLSDGSTLIAAGLTKVIGNIQLSNSTIVVPETHAPAPRVLLTYTGTRSGEFSDATLPAGWEIKYDDDAREIQFVQSPGAYSPWIEQFATNDRSGFTDDADADGIPNGLEFVLGGSPLVPGSSTLPRVEETPNGGHRYTFQRAARARGHSIVIANFSEDLIHWPSTSDIAIGPDTASSGPGVEITHHEEYDFISIHVPEGNPANFIRLEVREP
jgi:autotransporter-associated beta strand protein